MRKLPVFILAAATTMTLAVPMTAQAAAACPLTGTNTLTASCNGQNINSILSKLGCFNGNSNAADLKSCIKNSSDCTNSSSCSGNKNTCSNNASGVLQWKSCKGK